MYFLNSCQQNLSYSYPKQFQPSEQYNLSDQQIVQQKEIYWLCFVNIKLNLRVYEDLYPSLNKMKQTEMNQQITLFTKGEVKTTKPSLPLNM